MRILRLVAESEFAIGFHPFSTVVTERGCSILFEALPGRSPVSAKTDSS